MLLLAGSIVLVLVLVFDIVVTGAAEQRKRIREPGIEVGRLRPGPFGAMTDVRR
jgi:hypothetical protein